MVMQLAEERPDATDADDRADGGNEEVRRQGEHLACLADAAEVAVVEHTTTPTVM
jgi:hypothetical protein